MSNTPTKMTRSSKFAARRRKGRGLDISVCGRMLCPQLKGRVESAARAMALAMMGAKLANTLTLKITLVNPEGYNGAVHTLTAQSTTGLRAFPITLRRDATFDDTMRTLAHEIRHIEQFRRGRFQLRTWASDRKVHARWNGVEMGTLDSLPYYTRPWEVEARLASEQFGHLR